MSKGAMDRLARLPMCNQGPEVTCIICGRQSATGMGLLSSPPDMPHRWMCRNRKRCLGQIGLYWYRRASDGGLRAVS